MEELTTVVLSLGSNLGDRYLNLSKAIRHIKEEIGTVEKISGLYETPPMGFEASQDFLNLCLRMKTALSAEQFIERTQKIESDMGRVRSESGYSSRPLDIDIVFFGRMIMANEKLAIPHPRFRDRLFVLQPLTDLDLNIVDPITGKTMEELLKITPDNSPISRYKKDILLHE